MIKRRFLYGLAALVLFLDATQVKAASGAEGASFLNIPVGARPAAMGSSYSALATDAYAPTWNPGGLGLVDSTQLAGQHLSYLESIYYEYLSAVHPLGNGRALGASIQYLGSGNIAGTDLTGNAIGDYSAHYAAYSVAYGQMVTTKMSLGLTVKMINAKISDVGATAYAFDLGSLYQVNDRLRLAGVLTNVGSKLTFIDQADSLPLAFHLGGAYVLRSNVIVTAEGIYDQTGSVNLRTGIEWKPVQAFALRAGYRTDTLAGLSPLAGLSTGFGLEALGCDFSYAWVPLGELGNTHYFSLAIKFGAQEHSRNLISYQARKPRTVDPDTEDSKSDQELMELLNDNSTLISKNSGDQNAKSN